MHSLARGWDREVAGSWCNSIEGKEVHLGVSRRPVQVVEHWLISVLLENSKLEPGTESGL